MPRLVTPLMLSPEEHSELQRWLVALGTPQQVVLRCRIVLGLSAGKTEVMRGQGAPQSGPKSGKKGCDENPFARFTV